MNATRSGRAPDRRLALAAALVLLVACLLPWFAWSGDLPSTPRRGWEGSGILLGVAAAGVLALLTVPWAVRDEPDADRILSFVDSPLAWLLLSGLALVGVVVWPVAFLDAPGGLLPDRAPGLWLGAVGTVMLGVAAVRRPASRRSRR